MDSYVQPSLAPPSGEFQDSDGSSKSLSAIHGNFIPLQSSEGLFLIPPQRVPSPRRRRSPAPRRRQDQGVHLHLSLTDSQMDKLTSTLAKDDKLQTKSHRRADTVKNSSHFHPCQAKASTTASSNVQASDSSQGGYFGSHSRGHSLHGDCQDGLRSAVSADPSASPTHSCARSCSPDKQNSRAAGTLPIDSTSSHTSPERMQANMPSSITDFYMPSVMTDLQQRGPNKPETTHASWYAASHIATASDASNASHSSRKRTDEHAMTDTPSSVYSREELAKAIPRTSPLQVKKLTEMGSSGCKPTILQEYATWSAISPMSTSGPYDSGSGSGSVPPVSPYLGDHDTGAKSSTDSSHNDVSTNSTARAPFSPLTGVSTEAGPAVPRVAHKIMVGRNGWLERTGKAEKKPSPTKKGGIIDVLKRMAKEVAEVTDIKVPRRAKDSDRGRRSSRMRISLDPREQSLLYCELEFLLTSVLDGYINSQFNAGRLDADKYKKVVDAWHQRGRPKVVGFRFDLETQLDLVHLHARCFRFYGDRAGLPIAITNVLETMKVNARAMRIRTFCQPDSAIAKQLLDSQNLFNLIGCSEPRQIQLTEMIQFFKTVLEREG